MSDFLHDSASAGPVRDTQDASPSAASTVDAATPSSTVTAAFKDKGSELRPLFAQEQIPIVPTVDHTAFYTKLPSRLHRGPQGV